MFKSFPLKKKTLRFTVNLNLSIQGGSCLTFTENNFHTVGTDCLINGSSEKSAGIDR